MTHLDLGVVLGCRVGLNDSGLMALSNAARIRVQAAGQCWKSKLVDRFVISGGHVIGVRYALDMKIPVFGRPNSDRAPDFSEAAKEQAKLYRSEASVMAEVLNREFGVVPEALILEEGSYCTADNARLTAPIVTRLGVERIAVITGRDAMEKALREFQKVGILATPLVAEEFQV